MGEISSSHYLVPASGKTATERGMSFPVAFSQPFIKVTFYSAIMRTPFLPCQLSNKIQSRDQRSHKGTLLLGLLLTRSWLCGRSFSRLRLDVVPEPSNSCFPLRLLTLAWKSVMKQPCLGNFWKMKVLWSERTNFSSFPPATRTHVRTHAHMRIKPGILAITQGRREPRGFLTPGSTLPGSSLPLAPSSTCPRLLAVRGYTCSPKSILHSLRSCLLPA